MMQLRAAQSRALGYQHCFVKLRPAARKAPGGKGTLMSLLTSKGISRGFRSSRGLSILAAASVDLGLILLMILWHGYQPSNAESCWVSLLIAFVVYAVLQIWTLSTMTGRGDDFTAAADKFIALSPLVVVAVIEAYWLGAAGVSALSWRLHLVGGLCALFAITDFFATDIMNQRLRTRQVDVGNQSY